MFRVFGRHVASSNAGQVAEAPWPKSSDTIDYIDGLVLLGVVYAS